MQFILPDKNTKKQYSIIRDFPIIDNNVNKNERLCYLDNAATSQKPQSVIDSMTEVYQNTNAPINRGLYPLAQKATTAYDQARLKISQFIGLSDAKQLVFTKSATESINIIAQGWLRINLQAGDYVWVSAMEHHANLLPWQRVCKQTGAKLRFIELQTDGSLDLDKAQGLYDKKTKLIALTHISNVLGIINPIEEIIEKASKLGIAVSIDASQSVGHIPVDVKKLNCDFLSFSAHKMYGPCGIGAMYAKTEKLEQMEPLLLGGGMVDEVFDLYSTWPSSVDKFEAGSPNFPGAIGFASAVDYINLIGFVTIESIIDKLSNYALERLLKIEGLTIYGPTNRVKGSGIISFNINNIHPHDIAQIAVENNVAIRSGHHCCQPLMKRLGISSTARASLAIYNTKEDIDRLLDVINTSKICF